MSNTVVFNNVYIVGSATIGGLKEKEVDELCSRKAPNSKEKCPTIERIIYQDSLIDDLVCEDFRRILREMSI